MGIATKIVDGQIKRLLQQATKDPYVVQLRSWGYDLYVYARPRKEGTNVNVDKDIPSN